MMFFLNERSLEPHAEWVSALDFFRRSSQELKQVAAVKLFRDSYFFQHGATKARFNALPLPKDIRASIRDMIFSDKVFGCWRPERLSDAEHEFHCINPAAALRDESLSEAAEQRSSVAIPPVAVMSAERSQFGPPNELKVLRDGWASAADIRNFSSLESVKQWLAREKGTYNRDTARDPPKDFQTVLEKQPERFRFSGLIERHSDRKVFVEIDTRRQYCVDGSHYGHAAHLEVYSSEDEHLGIADIDTGTLDPSGRKPNRRLKV
jgi:hypothetical protein